MIPDRKKCLSLMGTHNMLPNIKKHSIMVCNVALSIARKLNKMGEHLDLAEIEAASLLHDITKTRSLENGENHADSGAALLHNMGYERIACIVGEHISPKRRDNTITEEEVVCYADKKVMHDKVVSLDERFDDLMKRYGTNKESVKRIDTMKERIKQLENKILQKAGL